MKNENKHTSPDLKEMIGQRMMFRCYQKVMHAETRDIDILVDSHDNLIILPDKDSNTFREDTWTWRYAIQSGKDHHCINKNGDQRIEVTGTVKEVRNSLLLLSDMEFEYKDNHLTEEEMNVKGTVVVVGNRL